jgi:hypothetical protein
MGLTDRARYPSGNEILARITSRSCAGTPIALRYVKTHDRSWDAWIGFPQTEHDAAPWVSRRKPSRLPEESRRANRSMSVDAPADVSSSESGSRVGVLQTVHRGIRRQVHAIGALSSAVPIIRRCGADRRRRETGGGRDLGDVFKYRMPD